MRAIWSRPMRCWLTLMVSILLALSLVPLPAFAAQASPDGETVAQGRTRALKVDVSGFVGGESAARAKGYTAPSVLLSEGMTSQNLVEGASYDLKPSGGVATNYAFTYKGAKLSVTKRADLAPGTSSYAFAGSVLYAVPLDLDISPAGAVAPKLDVDYNRAKKVSDNKAIPSLDATTGSGGTVPANTDSGGSGAGTSGDDTGDTNAPATPNTNREDAPGGGAPVPPTTPASAPEARSVTLAPGSYTVSANIWLSKQDTGLPLNPHLTNSSFPPKNPVENNATLTVSDEGHAQVSVPIAIQRRIMMMSGISGLTLTNSDRDGDGLSNITVDLGVIEGSTSVITKPCTVDITIGDLAMVIGGAIFGGVRNHTYPATFQMNLSGVPLSGGCTIPDAVRRAMEGMAGGSSDDVLGTVDEAKAQASEAAAQAKVGQSAHLLEGGYGAAARAEEVLATNPALTFALGVVSTLIVGGVAAGGVHFYRRRKNLVAKGEKL